MGRFTYLAAIVSVAGAMSAPALAVPLDQGVATAIKTRLKQEVRSLQTYATKPQLDRWVVPDARYSGVGGLFIETTGGGGFICTGSLIAPGLALTAAHCLDDPGITRIRMFLPSYLNENGTTAGRQVLTANAFALHPDYDSTGNGVLGAGDLAVVRFATPAAANRQIYGLYDGLGEIDNESYQKIGTGTIGLGRTGTFADDVNWDLRKRAGLNLYEFDFGGVIDALFGFTPGETGCAAASFLGFACTGILVFDMDSGRAANDVFGLYMGKPQLGLRYNGILVDANSSPGDSGGPTFIDGKIAGITSWGLTGAIFEPGNCGRGSVDVTADADGFCTNSSYGEISGDTRVSAYRDWLNPIVQAFSDPNRPAVLAASWLPLGGVPEPQTWAMMIAGFGLVGHAARRRRAQQAQGTDGANQG